MAYEEDPTVPPLTVRTAANRLGMSVWGVHKAIDRGELRPVVKNPIKVLASDVEAMRLRKRDEAIAQIGLDRMAKVARDIRLQLHPPGASGAPREHAALDLIPERAKAAFTMPLLHAAAMPDGSGCRWCAAVVAGRMLAVPVPKQLMASEVGLALLGAPECETHQALARGAMDGLRAHVHPGKATRRPEPAVTAAAPPKPATPPKTATAPVQPSPGRSVGWQPRRKTASAAAARPGVLRCGHALAAGCTCPRRASRRAPR